MSYIKEKLFALWISPNIFAELAMRMLEKCWSWGTRLNVWLEWSRAINPEETVYDIVDAGQNHCYCVLTPDGMLIAHNCLGMQFGMGQRTLAASIANVTGEEPDPDGALELIRGYREAYPEYSRMVQRLREAYQAGAGIMLPNGWRLGPNSPSILSASNVPIQGTGSVILQEACRRIDAAEIPIIATLHDSITLYCPERYVEEMVAEASRLMVEAADDVLGVKGMRVGEAEIVKNGDYWIHGERAARDWPRYKKHFIKEE